MRDKVVYNRRNKLIYEKYCSAWAEGLRDEIIFKELAETYHLTAKRIEAVVRMMRKESQKAQPEIDFGRDLNSNENEAE